MAKATNPIPPGFHSLTPHLTVSPAHEYLNFLKSAFGAEEVNVSPGPGGKLMHATVRIGDSMLMFNDDFGTDHGMPPLAQGRLPFVLHLYVHDADAAWAQALAAGCQATMPLANQFWGSRYGVLRDPFGITWSIATHVEDLSQEEMMQRAQKAFSQFNS